VESFSRVLEKYGMEKTREKKKHRISYRLHGIEFDIDEYEGIPPLLEIEANRREEIDVLVGKLDLTKNEQMIG
jgi:adenylate cyclase class IV